MVLDGDLNEQLRMPMSHQNTVTKTKKKTLQFVQEPPFSMCGENLIDIEELLCNQI